ncbi:sensor domain-containing diguanylate cyclase [Paenibacillus sp. YYML68]|uniref:sensor domain-containing diguanylate cyclase n=1 Tax=Paenibacillus sp. YYML68 TaxID=2909250 RepID=UPI0024936F1D|nr:sensor domain-containing diguanylate cyclase [Paenibacillus sp. YYML68]
MKLTSTLKHKMNLQMILAGLVAASVLLTICIQLVASYRSHKTALIDTTLSLNYSNVQKISSTIQSLFVTMQGSLKQTAHFVVTRPDQSDRDIEEHLELVRSTNHYFNSIAWADETGKIRSIAPHSIGLQGVYVKDSYSKEAIDTKRPYISPPYIGPAGRLIVLISHPIFDKQGAYRGVIGGTIYLEEGNVLNELLDHHFIDETGTYFYVVGPKGMLLFHPEQQQIGSVLGNHPVLAKLMSGQSGKELVYEDGKLTQLAAYAPIPINGWGAVQQTPIDSVYEQLNDHIYKLTLYMLVPFGMLLIAAVIIARKLARPFVSLADLMNQLSTGQPVAIPEMKPHWNREATLLTTAVVFAIEAVQKSKDELLEAASTDELTSLMNRRTINEQLDLWTSEKRPFCLIVLDIDRFKSVNDTYGHQMGDEVLKHLARLLTDLLQPSQLCGRYGGEEFVLLLPQATAEQAYKIAERLRRKVQAAVSPTGQPITISMGIAEFPRHAQSSSDLFQQADQAMYRAKQYGRNRTLLASDTDTGES